jgi:L-asparaginase/Glu-tRNA(Gln) amidotransferase subunit D
MLARESLESRRFADDGSCMSTLPRIAVIATGGTIAGVSTADSDTTGYQAGALPITQLLAGVPQLGSLAAEQPFSEDSKDLTPAHWLILARRVQARLNESTIDAVAFLMAHLAYAAEAVSVLQSPHDAT